MKQHIIISGGSGYIGTELVRLALAQGRKVTLLSRSKNTTTPNITFKEWRLGEPLPHLDVNPQDCAVIHLAHDWKNQASNHSDEGGLNREGTLTLFQSAQKKGIERFIFVSSQSARQDAPNIYGRVKWAIEQTLNNPMCISARVGLVYGGNRKVAMFGLMNTLVSKLPILPMISPWRKVQPIHIREVCLGLLALADGTQNGWRGLAGAQPQSFGDVLVTLARIAHGRKIFILPVPIELALLGAKILSFIPFLPKVDKERILGLAGTQTMDCEQHLKEMDLDVVPLSIGLSKDNLGTRGLIAEGRILLAYTLGHSASSSLTRRYVKALRAIDTQSQPIGIFPIFIQWPQLIRFIDPIGTKKLIGQRLHLAASLVDASVEGTDHLREPRLKRLAKLFISLSLDVLALPFRVISSILGK
jgi:NADH dehydrogenase